jgi:hypothetical protein
MVSHQPGEVLERRILPPILERQLRQTQRRIIGEVAARVASDEPLERQGPARAIRAQGSERLGVLPLLARDEILRGGLPHSPAAEDQ